MADDILQDLTLFEVPAKIFSEPEDLDRLKQKEVFEFSLAKLVAEHFVN